MHEKDRVGSGKEVICDEIEKIVLMSNLFLLLFLYQLETLCQTFNHLFCF